MTSDGDPGPHRPRHSAADQNVVSTTILPRIVDDMNPWAQPEAPPEPPAHPSPIPLPAPPPDTMPVPPPHTTPVPPAHPMPVPAAGVPSGQSDDAPVAAAEMAIDPNGATIILAEPATAHEPATVDSVPASQAPSAAEANPDRTNTTESLGLASGAETGPGLASGTKTSPVTPSAAETSSEATGPEGADTDEPGSSPRPVTRGWFEPVVAPDVTAVISMPGAGAAAGTSPNHPAFADPPAQQATTLQPVRPAIPDPPVLPGIPDLPAPQTAPPQAISAGPPGPGQQRTERASDPEATAVFPRITAAGPGYDAGPHPAEHRSDPPAGAAPAGPGPDADATAVIPRIPMSSTEGVTTANAVPPPAAPDDNGSADGADAVPRGVKVVPLRPVRTEEGYRSVYSDLTRTTPGSVIRAIIRTTGELCITLGMILLLFAAYEVWGKTAAVNAHQDDLNSQLAEEWGAPAPAASPSAGPKTDVLPPPDGKAIARMYIPRIGKQWIVVQGVTPGDIRFAPGHYPSSAMPGQIGNFSVAGHRTPAIFWDLDQIHNGDDIVVETKDTWYVYKTRQTEIVSPHAVQVVAPVPNQPGRKPTEQMITLTTCNPKFNNYQRLIIHGVLDPTETHTRDQGRPAVLGG
jgi:LPXTG-site transpeptidase (sortase) family protein